MTEAPTDAAAPVHERRWGIGDVAVGFLVAQLGGIIAISIILQATGRASDEVEDLPLALTALSQLGLWLGLLGVPWLATRLKGGGLVADLGLRARWNDLWVGLGVGVGLQLVVIPLLYWPLLALLDKDAAELEEPARLLTDKAEGPLSVALLVLIVGIGAPVIEEIFYRGFFQGALLKRGLAPAIALPLVAFVFGGSHFQLLQLPALFLFGLAAGLLARRYDRLGPAIAAHVAFNMVSVVLLLASD